MKTIRVLELYAGASFRKELGKLFTTAGELQTHIDHYKAIMDEPGSNYSLLTAYEIQYPETTGIPSITTIIHKVKEFKSIRELNGPKPTLTKEYNV